MGGGNGGGVVGRGIFLVCGSGEVVITMELGGILVFGIEKLGISGTTTGRSILGGSK